jgi:hypothetical protein
VSYSETPRNVDDFNSRQIEFALCSLHGGKMGPEIFKKRYVVGLVLPSSPLPEVENMSRPFARID